MLLSLMILMILWLRKPRLSEVAAPSYSGITSLGPDSRTGWMVSRSTQLKAFARESDKHSPPERKFKEDGAPRGTRKSVSKVAFSAVMK